MPSRSGFCVGGVSSGDLSSPIYHGSPQRPCGLPVSPQPSLGLQVDPQDQGISGAAEEVACDHRPVCHLSQSPMFNIFLSVPRSERLGDRCSAPELEWVAGVCLSTLVTHSRGSQEALVVVWSPPYHRSSVLASEAVVSRSSVSRCASSAPLSSTPSGGVRAGSSCLETIQRFAQVRGFSKHVAKQSALARRASSRVGYQARWSIYHHGVIRTATLCLDLRCLKLLIFCFGSASPRSLQCLRFLGIGQCYRLCFVRYCLRSPLLRLRSFKVEAPCRTIRPPAWDLLKVLDYLQSSVFEPLSNSSLRDLNRKMLFLVALATAKRVGEIQALSRFVSFSSSAAGVSYVPEFLAKTETAVRPLPRSFAIQSLGDFVAGLPDDLLLWPVRSLHVYVSRTSCFVNSPRRLVVSPRCPSRSMSKNAISYFLYEVIVHSGSSSESVAATRTHSIRGIATSSAFFKNWSIASVLDATSWRSNTVFTSFYFKDMHYIFENVRSLGPFVAAGERIG